MVALDKVLLEKQKQVYKFILRRLGSSLFNGNALNFSLPVTVFRRESQLELLAHNWSLAPVVL